MEAASRRPRRASANERKAERAKSKGPRKSRQKGRRTADSWWAWIFGKVHRHVPWLKAYHWWRKPRNLLRETISQVIEIGEQLVDALLLILWALFTVLCLAIIYYAFCFCPWGLYGVRYSRFVY